MNKEKLSKTISLLMHQNLCVVNNGTKEKPDFVVGGTELLNTELTKLFSLYDVVVPKGTLVCDRDHKWGGVNCVNCGAMPMHKCNK